MQSLKKISSVLLFFFLFGLLLRFALIFIILPTSELTASIAKPFLYGIRFDFAASGIATLLFFLLNLLFARSERVSRILFSLLIICYSVLWTGDTLYVLDTGKHIGYEMAAMASIFKSSWAIFLRFTPVFLALCAFSYFVSIYFTPNEVHLAKIRSFIICLPFCFLAFRGSEPIAQDPSWALKAGNELSSPTIALNPIYNMSWRLIKNKNTKAYVKLDRSTIIDEPLYEQFIKGRHNQINSSVASAPNIVIVFLESWWGTQTRETTPELTPFYNKLRKDSLSPDLLLAGGHRTTEGIFATLCSRINPFGRSIMYSELEDRNFKCLNHLLESQKNYDSAFFQGSDKDTSGTGALTVKVGFKNTYGKNEIPNLEKLQQNAWGVFDEDLYSFVLSKLPTLSEPHIIGINTNTTHDRKISQKSEYAGFSLTIEQADRELEKFYADLVKHYGKKEWLLVLVADHTNYSGSVLLDHYDIPMLLKFHNNRSPIPRTIKPGIYQQIDIATTLAEITGVSVENFEGRSLFSSNYPGSGIYHNSKYLWADDSGDAVLIDIPEINKFKCFNIFKDRKLEHELQCGPKFQDLHRIGASYLFYSQENLFKK